MQDYIWRKTHPNVSNSKNLKHIIPFNKLLIQCLNTSKTFVVHTDNVKIVPFPPSPHPKVNKKINKDLDVTSLPSDSTFSPKANPPITHYQVRYHYPLSNVKSTIPHKPVPVPHTSPKRTRSPSPLFSPPFTGSPSTQRSPDFPGFNHSPPYPQERRFQTSFQEQYSLTPPIPIPDFEIVTPPPQPASKIAKSPSQTTTYPIIRSPINKLSDQTPSAQRQSPVKSPFPPSFKLLANRFTLPPDALSEYPLSPSQESIPPLDSSEEDPPNTQSDDPQYKPHSLFKSPPPSSRLLRSHGSLPPSDRTPRVFIPPIGKDSSDPIPKIPPKLRNLPPQLPPKMRDRPPQIQTKKEHRE